MPPDTATEPAVKREPHPIFAACCGPSSRYAIDRPFLLDGYLCATDTRIVVRSKGEWPGWSIEDKAPPVHGLNWEGPKAGTEYALDDPGEIVTTTEDCDECDGDGHVTCDYDHEHDCPECHAAGRITTKKLPPHPQFGDATLNAEYAVLLYRHGVRAVRHTGDKRQPFYFTGDGFEGLVGSYGRDD